jgi:hypothetical protein
MAALGAHGAHGAGNTREAGMNGRAWSEPELRRLRHFYPHIKTEYLAHQLQRALYVVYSKARALKLCKTPEYLASPDACRLRREASPRSIACRFLPGSVPVNKGLRRPGYSPGRMAETQFKKGSRHGHAAQFYKPLGSLRLSKEGYLQRKILETGYPPRDWKGVHIILWEEHYGPIPSNHAIGFIDGNKENIIIENLVLLSRADLMRRNTIHNYPLEIRQVIRLTAKLRRTIARHNDEKQDRRSA